MSVCEKKGHDFYPTTRRVTTMYGLTSYEEDILYCARCGSVRSLGGNPYYKTTDYGVWSFTTGTTTTSGFLYFDNLYKKE